MPRARKPKDIDDYISRFPVDVQEALEKVRTTISQAAPEAKEMISYQMPAFKLHGILVYFAAWKKHIGLYPPVSGDNALEKAVARYAGPNAGSADSLRLDRTDREAPGNAGLGESCLQSRRRRASSQMSARAGEG
jgi:hypothetical protein